MSRENNPIDELFRDKLENYSMDAPDHVFTKVMARRSGFYKAMLAVKSKGVIAVASLFMAGIAGTTIYLNMQDDSTKEMAPATTTAVLPATPAEQDKTIVMEQPAATQATQTLAENAGGSTASVPGTQTGYPHMASNNQPHNSAADAITTGNDTEKAQAQTATSNATPEEHGGEGVKPVAQNPKTDDAIASVPATEKIDLPIANDQAIAATDTKAIDQNDGIDNTDKTDKEAEAKNKKDAKVKPDWLVSKWSVDAVAGVNLSGRSITGDAAYVNARNKAEKAQLGYSFTLRANYKFNKVLSIGAGLQFTQFNEQLNFNRNVQSTQVDYKTVNGYRIDPVTSQLVPFTRSYWDTSIVTNNVSARSANTYKFIDVPVQMNYAFFTTPKFNIYATAGAIFNLSFSQSGQQLRKDLDGTFQVSSQSPFKANAGVSVLAGLGLEYSACHNFSILVEPSFRQGVNSVFRNDYGVSQTFRAATLGVGLRYRF